MREPRYAECDRQYQLGLRRRPAFVRTCPLRERKRPNIPPVHPCYRFGNSVSQETKRATYKVHQGLCDEVRQCGEVQ